MPFGPIWARLASIDMVAAVPIPGPLSDFHHKRAVCGLYSNFLTDPAAADAVRRFQKQPAGHSTHIGKRVLRRLAHLMHDVFEWLLILIHRGKEIFDFINDHQNECQHLRRPIVRLYCDALLHRFVKACDTLRGRHDAALQVGIFQRKAVMGDYKIVQRGLLCR